MTRTEVLSDAEWSRIEPLLPSSAGRPGRPFRDHRQVVEGIIYRYRAGISWRDLPKEFGPYQTVWKRQARWSKDGTWDRLLTRLQAEADAVGELNWQVSVDSTVVRVHQSGATARRSLVRPSSHTGGSVE
jgi:transposase